MFWSSSWGAEARGSVDCRQPHNCATRPPYTIQYTKHDSNKTSTHEQLDRLVDLLPLPLLHVEAAVVPHQQQQQLLLQLLIIITTRKYRIRGCVSVGETAAAARQPASQPPPITATTQPTWIVALRASTSTTPAPEAAAAAASVSLASSMSELSDGQSLSDPTIIKRCGASGRVRAAAAVAAVARCIVVGVVAGGWRKAWSASAASSSSTSGSRRGINDGGCIAFDFDELPVSVLGVWDRGSVSQSNRSMGSGLES